MLLYLRPLDPRGSFEKAEPWTTSAFIAALGFGACALEHFIDF